MPAAAIPAIIGAGGAIGSGLLGFFGAKRASTPSPVETQAQQTQTDASKALGAQGALLTNYGMPKLQQAGNYFSTLAGGNRAATAQALAPDVANINSTYGGAQRTISRFLRGPERDMQLGDLSRQRAGAVGSLFTGARDRGVSGLASLGEYGVGQGTAAYGGAANIASGVQGMGMQNRFGGAALQRQAGADTASLIFQLLRSGLFSGKGSGGSTPNIPTMTGWPSTMPGTPVPGWGGG